MKKIISVIIAAVMLCAAPAAFAQSITVAKAGNTRAVLLCYDTEGALVYSRLLKSADGSFEADVPSQYDNTEKKVYLVDTQEFTVPSAAATEAPAASEAPVATTAPTAAPAPAKTPRPTEAERLSGTPFTKEIDSIYSPAVVVEVETNENSKGEEVYTLTLFYHGQEIKLDVERDMTISSAPTAYSYLAGQTMGALEAGDVLYITTSISGDEIRSIDVITRPTEEDIVTGTTNYGTSFERLFSSGGKVAGQWKAMTYGSRSSGDRYQYAFGVVGKMSKGNLTLLNKSTDPNDAIEIDVDPNAYVYVCDVSGKKYDLSIGGIGDIEASLPSKLLDKDTIELTSDYSYNYALVRTVDGTATEVVLYSNYNY